MVVEKGGGLGVGGFPRDRFHVEHSNDLRQVGEGVGGKAALFASKQGFLYSFETSGDLLWP